MSAITHPRYGPRRGAGPMPWWGKAWTRAVEEAAYHQRDLRAGRSLARGGKVGSLTVDDGSLVAAVQQGDDAWTVSITLPVLAADQVEAFAELVAAEAGRIADLLAGDLPHQLIEAAEEAGVEVLPYGGELEATCSCDTWAQPCPHSLAVLTQFGWLIGSDPLALLHLRGLPREALLAALHELTSAPRDTPDTPVAEGLPGGGLPDEDVDESVAADVEVGVDTARRAAALLREQWGVDAPTVDS